MACAPFVWPRQSALSSTALASWPTPTLPSWPAPSVTLQTQTKEERDKCEDLLDSLILQAAEQKSKEDMMASLHETSGRPNVARTQLKKPLTSPCRVRGFLTAFSNLKPCFSFSQRFWSSGYCGYGDACIYRHISQQPTIEER